MDYEAEQQMELEALEAILMDDLSGAYAYTSMRAKLAFAPLLTD